MLSDLLLVVAGSYPSAGKENFSSNELAERIRGELPRALQQDANISEDYKVYASPGTGNWAEVPWLAVLDRDITTSTQDGYYIVYLFSVDGKRIYLSLAVGWEQFASEYGNKQGRIEIQDTVAALSASLRSTRGFETGPIALGAKGALAQGYEIGSVCSKRYEVATLPSDAELIDDFRNLLGVYREMPGLVGNSVMNLPTELKEAAVSNQIEKEIKIAETSAMSREEALAEIDRITALAADQSPRVRAYLARSLARNRGLAHAVKARTEWRCEVCGVSGFTKRDGTLYAEAHHKLELAESRLDIAENMICVCPTCHKVIHYGSDEELSLRSETSKIAP